MSVMLAGLGALLAVPRPVPPESLPRPAIDRSAERHMTLEDERRADAAMAQPLPFDVRAVGEAMRQLGSATADGDHQAATDWLHELALRTRIARSAHGDEALLRLRALQLRLFMQALRRWETEPGQPPRELQQLGGNFAQKAQERGWLEAHRLVMTDAERRAHFRVRWVNLVGLRQTPPFQPGTNEWRIYYAFLLRHPDAASDAKSHHEACLDYVRTLSDLDPSYPGDYGRGVLLFELGAKQAAAEAFRRHLTRHPDGPWTLRARNHYHASVGLPAF